MSVRALMCLIVSNSFLVREPPSTNLVMSSIIFNNAAFFAIRSSCISLISASNRCLRSTALTASRLSSVGDSGLLERVDISAISPDSRWPPRNFPNIRPSPPGSRCMSESSPELVNISGATKPKEWRSSPFLLRPIISLAVNH